MAENIEMSEKRQRESAQQLEPQPQEARDSIKGSQYQSGSN